VTEAPPPAGPNERARGVKASNDRSKRRRILWGEFVFGLGMGALGAYFAFGAFNIRLLPSYSRIGPRFFPLLVAFGLLLCAVLLLLQALRGKAAPPEAAEDADITAPTDWLAVAMLGAALLVDILLIERLGFVVASTLLFWGVAFAFGSRNYLRDAGVGLALSLAVYLAFTRLLDLSLPAGIVPLLWQAASSALGRA
jgi:putative tricarboxylic transport membrane protein